MATIFVDSTATGSNNGTSWTDAYTSLATAVAAATTTDNLLLVSGTFAETVTVTTAGSASAPIVIQGDDKSGGASAGNPATFTINASGLTNGLDTTLGAGSNAFYVFKNMRVTAATGSNVAFDNIRHCTYKNCRFDNAGSFGIECANTGHYFQHCEIDTNGGGGIDSGAGGSLIGCSVHGNTGDGFNTTGGGLVFGTLFYGNTVNDIENDTTTSGFHVVNCTFVGGTKAGAAAIRLDGTDHRAENIMNCIFEGYNGASGYGIYCLSNDLGEMSVNLNNCVYNAPYNNSATHSGEVTSDPSFVGGGDYSLSASSPCINTGTDVGDL